MAQHPNALLHSAFLVPVLGARQISVNPMDENFSETSNTIAAKVPCDPGTVRDYADAGWLECRRLASGTRLFKPSAVERVRKLRAERLARRGRPPRERGAAA